MYNVYSMVKHKIYFKINTVFNKWFVNDVNGYSLYEINQLNCEMFHITTDVKFDRYIGVKIK